ncbi:MAG: Fic family protein [Candidatus Melainabacteria bacterium]|nr:Fic family protein [Candidatus Melainabacteria bacterium]
MYIHELPTWPSFEWSSDTLAQPLATVRHKQGRLIGRMESLGFKLKQEANFLTLTQDVLTTSEIEGQILDPQQVRSSLARRLGIKIAALKPADREVDGVVEMMLDATQNFAKPLTAERLFGLHAALFPRGWSGMFRIKIGDWRDGSSGPMQVVSGVIGREQVHFQTPPAELVAKEMHAFLEWFEHNHEIDPVLKSGIAHLWFVTIHPFDDGNGRIARAIADMALARSEQVAERFYSMSAQIRTERKGYYDILERTQKRTMDITPWLEWFLACLERSIDGAQAIQAVVLHKAQFWNSLSKLPINNRQNIVLNRLLEGFEGKLTSSKWAKLAKCSQDTAHRDINDLVERGVLKKDQAGGRSTSYSLADKLY